MPDATTNNDLFETVLPMPEVQGAGDGDTGTKRRRAPQANSESTRRAASEISIDDRLRMLVSVMARIAVPETRLRELVVGRAKNSEGWIKAYNAFDGSHSQREAATLAGVDEGHLSRAIARWIAAGILFRVGTPEVLLGLYPIPTKASVDSTDD